MIVRFAAGSGSEADPVRGDAGAVDLGRGTYDGVRTPYCLKAEVDSEVGNGAKGRDPVQLVG